MHPSYHANPAYNQQYARQLSYQQQLAMQSTMPPSIVMGGHPPQQPLLHHHHIPHQTPPQTLPQQPEPHPGFYQHPKVGRLPADRPLMKLSVSLIDTYKRINTVYYEERDTRRGTRATEPTKKVQGVKNNGWDDDSYDYIINPGELFYNRYRIQERIGKGSFGQVVRAEDIETKQDVAIKIIKSKKPFQMQAKTEIELLTHLNQKDQDDEHNIVRLIDHFMYRDHQCLVFEMLSLNLCELLKNTQFGGVSLNLIRKFGKQVLMSLMFLAREDVDVIHCDLKPENILLRHPKKSGIKVIDFGQTGKQEWILRQEKVVSSSSEHSQPPSVRDDVETKEPIVPSHDPIASLSQVIRAETQRKKKYPPNETGNSMRNYGLFVDLIHRMLSFDPKERITPQVALRHPFITATD
ncbi:MAG: hypothetical protein SGBAC_004289 [Bacillariaceae sp.]